MLDTRMVSKTCPDHRSFPDLLQRVKEGVSRVSSFGGLLVVMQIRAENNFSLIHQKCCILVMIWTTCLKVFHSQGTWDGCTLNIQGLSKHGP